MTASTTIEERFWAKVEKTPHGCWLWTGACTKGGYPVFTEQGRQVYAHRWAYARFVGEIPEGMQIDHRCNVRRCVNYETCLRPLSPRDNILRSEAPAAKNARKARCIRGHILYGKNLYTSSKGRHCRKCQRERDRKTYLRKISPTSHAEP